MRGAPSSEMSDEYEPGVMNRKSPQVLAIMGARSGSKGVPNKNIRPLAGKPLMAWVIQAALAAQTVNRVIVSTDSPEYAQVAREYGADVPFLRPPELALDLSTDYEYVKHAIDWLEANEGYVPDIVLRLLVTVPMQQPEDLDALVQILMNEPLVQSAVVVAEARQHPQKALKLIEDGSGGFFLSSYITSTTRDVTPTPRQSYPKAYFRANVVATRTHVVKTSGSLTGDPVRPHIIPQERAVDIDSLLDFFVVEKLMEHFGMLKDKTTR